MDCSFSTDVFDGTDEELVAYGKEYLVGHYKFPKNRGHKLLLLKNEDGKVQIVKEWG